MHNPAFARLLLILALLFTQMGGLTHAVSHLLAEPAQGTDQSLPDDHKLCELCAVYAQIGSALTSSTIQFASIDYASVLQPGSPASSSSRSFAAFAARAPPCSVS